MNTNYYHRTHKNYNYGSRGKVDHFDCPTNLFSLNNTDKRISSSFNFKNMNRLLTKQRESFYFHKNNRFDSRFDLPAA